MTAWMDWPSTLYPSCCPPIRATTSITLWDTGTPWQCNHQLQQRPRTKNRMSGQIYTVTYTTVLYNICLQFTSNAPQGTVWWRSVDTFFSSETYPATARTRRQGVQTMKRLRCQWQSSQPSCTVYIYIHIIWLSYIYTCIVTTRLCTPTHKHNRCDPLSQKGPESILLFTYWYSKKGTHKM